MCAGITRMYSLVGCCLTRRSCLQSPFKALRGHSRIVTALAFSFDNAWLVSVGGEDCAAFKWRLTAEPEVAVDASSKTVWCVVPLSINHVP